MTYITIPQWWESYMLSALVRKNNINNAGLVDIVPTAKISDRWHNPKLTNLIDVLGADTVRTTSSTLTAESLADYEEKYPAVHRYQGVKIYDNNTLEKGVDHWSMLRGQVPDVVWDKIQTTLVNVVNGQFGTSGVLDSSHKVDKSSVSITPMMITEAAEDIMGDQLATLNKVIMHSKIYYDLQSNLDQRLTVTEDGSKMVKTYLGDKEVLLNNTLCAPTSSVYPTYIVGDKPFILGWQKSMWAEDERLPRNALTNYIWHWDFAPGLKGVSYTGSTDNPTNAQLATVSNWTSVTPTAAALKLVRLETL